MGGVRVLGSLRQFGSLRAEKGVCEGCQPSKDANEECQAWQPWSMLLIYNIYSLSLTPFFAEGCQGTHSRRGDDFFRGAVVVWKISADSQARSRLAAFGTFRLAALEAHRALVDPSVWLRRWR